MTTDWPEGLRTVAMAVHPLLRENLPWVHDQMREWAESRYNRQIACNRKKKRRQKAVENIVADPRLQDKQAGPPKKGWIWGIITDPLPERGKDDIATGWFPPDVIEIDEGGDPLIKGEPSDVPYKVTRLSAHCTAYFDTEDPIIPPEWPDLNARATKAKSKADKRDRSAAICYEVLVKSSANLTPQQAGKLGVYSWKVQEAINNFESAKTGAAAIGLNYPNGDMLPVYKHVGDCVAAIKAAGRNLPAILEVLRDDISYWCFHLGDYEEEFLNLLPKGVLKAGVMGVMTGYEITRSFQGGKKAYEIIAFRKSVEYANHIADELDKFGTSRREFFNLLRSFPGADNPKYREWRISVSGNSGALEKMGVDLVERIDFWISELSADNAPEAPMQALNAPPQTETPAVETPTDIAAREETDQPDENGFIKNPPDPTAYRPVSKIIKNHWLSPPLPDIKSKSNKYKPLYKILSDEPTIHQWKPDLKAYPEYKPYKHWVHLGHWTSYVDRLRELHAKAKAIADDKQLWRCKKCGQIFLDRPDDALCANPNCRSDDVEPIV